MAETSSKKPVKKVAAKVPAKTAAENLKPAARKPVAGTTASAKAAPATALAAAAAAPAKAAAGKVMRVTDEQRYRMVAEAAYYRAESNHFKSDPLRDWIEAESDISALLSGGK